MKSLDRFIKSVRMEVAKEHNFSTHYEVDAFFIGLEEASKDNQEALEKRDKMLRDTVADLVEAKRLLKLAVEDIDNARHGINCGICGMQSCDVNNVKPECKYRWQYADEVEKLINEEI